MAKVLNTINGIQNDTTVNTIVKKSHRRRGKAKDVAIQSHAHVDEYVRKLEIGEAIAKQKARDYKTTCDRLDKAYETYAKYMADAFKDGVKNAVRDTAMVNGHDFDKVSANNRETVKRANARPVARTLHDPDEYSVKQAVADSTVPVKAEKKAEKPVKKTVKKAEKPVKAEKKAEKAETKKTVKADVNADAKKSLDDLYNAGLITECAYNRALKKLDTTVKAEKKAEKPVKTEKADTVKKTAPVKAEKTAPVKAEKTAPVKRTYGKKGGYRKPERKVEMTNVREVVAKNGVKYNVGEFVHTQTGERIYGVWMDKDNYCEEGVKWLKDTFGVYYSKFALAFLFSYKPDTYLRRGTAKKTA